MARIGRFLLLAFIPVLLLGKSTVKLEVNDFLDKIQKFQENIRTLKVTFTQTNDFKMLTKPEVLKGTIFIKKPATALYLYEHPDKLYYLVKDGELLVYNPTKKEATVQDIERYQNKIMKYMGLSTPFKELEKKFDVVMTEEGEETAHLSFTPKKHSLAKKLSNLDFWVNEKDLTVKEIEISEAEGDKVRFEFSEWQINSNFDEKVFDIDLPKGIKIKRSGINVKEPFS